MQTMTHQQIGELQADFFRDYLAKVIAFMGISGWIILTGLLFLAPSFTVVAVLILFLLVWWLNFRLVRHAVPLARHAAVLTFSAWALAFLWLTRDPAALVGLILVGQVSMMLLPPLPALAYLGLTTVAALASVHTLAPGQGLTWQLLSAPLLALVTTGLSLIWREDLDTVLAWAHHSTQAALERLTEAQEHRAQLERNMKDLDEAYRRLERANDMLILARAEAEEARQARNRLALTVSHELRTPLNFIIGFSEVMVNLPQVYAPLDRWPPGLYEDLQKIYHSSNHLARLVNDILSLGQAEARRLALVKEWVKPAQIVQEVEALMRSAFAAKGLWLRVEAEPDLPELFLDRTRIRQVLINLLSNSLRFTEKGGVTVRLGRTENAVQVTVQDTGPGIHQEDIPKVFEEFGQATSTVWRRRNGSGLGIPISRRFVELHGGRMWLESQVGEGTAFHFTLPLPGTQPEQPAPSSTDSEYWRYLTEKARGHKTIVVLSNDPGAGELLAQGIEGYRIVVLTDAEQARQKLLELLPQALVVERTLAKQAAVEQLIRELPYDLPVITLRLPGSPSRPEALPEDIADYLVKPVQRTELVQAVHNLGPGVRTLLVVDDDPAMARLITLALAAEREEKSSNEQYRLLTAYSGSEALTMLERERPDALILDLVLPDVSGWELLQKMRANAAWAALPVIVITAYEWSEAMERSERDVLQISVRRRYSTDELTASLKALLDTIQPSYPEEPIPGVPVRPAGLAVQPAS